MNTALLETINRTCEANIDYGKPQQQVISTGIPALDYVTSGIPVGRIVEIFESEGSGKTALALHLAQQTGGPVLYVDADHGLSPYILRGREIYLLDVETLEDTLEACQKAIIGGFRAVVIDTIAALPTREESRIGINDKCVTRNDQAKVMSKCLPILNGLLHVTGCTLILVNQMRNNPSVLFGRPDYSTGGKAVSYYAALRLETRRVGNISSGGIVTGQEMVVNVRKCKYAPPGRRAVIKLMYGV